MNLDSTVAKSSSYYTGGEAQQQQQQQHHSNSLQPSHAATSMWHVAGTTSGALPVSAFIKKEPMIMVQSMEGSGVNPTQHRQQQVAADMNLMMTHPSWAIASNCLIDGQALSSMQQPLTSSAQRTPNHHLHHLHETQHHHHQQQQQQSFTELHNAPHYQQHPHVTPQHQLNPSVGTATTTTLPTQMIKHESEVLHLYHHIESSQEVMARLASYDLRNDGRIIETVRSFVSEQLTPSLHDLSNLFHNLCWLLEQALFTLVDWARHAEYFQTISVEDQMQLLNSSWSEVLLVEYLYHMTHTFGNEALLQQHSTAEFASSTDLLHVLGQTELRNRLVELMARLEALQLTAEEFSAIKFLLLFNPGKHDVFIQKSQDFIETVQFRISNALLDYTVTRSTHIPDKYGQILLRLPEIKFIAFKLETLLLEKFKAGAIPRNTLIAEMLISKSSRNGVGSTL